jgi:F-type H+-transporting ATPase subunit delta
MAQAEREKPKHDTVMDVTEQQIARVYAQAFMGVAAKSPKTAELVEEVGSIVTEVLDKFPKLDESLSSEFIAPDYKQGVVDRVLGGRASVEVLNFLKVLTAHGRLGLLRPIAQALKKLYAQRRGLTDVDVRVAKELDEPLHKEIQEQLRKILATEPVLRTIVDPSLIAGIVIQVGDKVYDWSLQTQLKLARKVMIEHAVEAIETRPERFVQTAG